MLVLFYYNWNGKYEDMYKWEKEVKTSYEKIDDIKIKGMYSPSIPWNRVWIFETDSVDKLLASWGGHNDNIRNTNLVILT